MAPARRKTKDIDELADRLGSMDIGAPSPNNDSEPETDLQPFRFFHLPYELRLRVYEELLLFHKIIDLDPANTRAIVPHLRPFYVSRRMHHEASRVFYGRNTFRIFPIHGRFIYTKRPLLARLPKRYRASITRLELRLGPSWTAPPKGWVTDARLGLHDISKAYKLRIFVEVDPASHDVFEGFRKGDDFYTSFSVNLVKGLLQQLPSITDIEFDAYPSVKKTSPLLQGLLHQAKSNHKRVLWGSERGWDKIVDVDLVNVLQKMGLEAL